MRAEPALSEANGWQSPTLFDGWPCGSLTSRHCEEAPLSRYSGESRRGNLEENR